MLIHTIIQAVSEYGFPLSNIDRQTTYLWFINSVTNSCYYYCELHAPAVVLDPKCSTRETVNYGEQTTSIGVDAEDGDVVGKDEVDVISYMLYKTISRPQLLLQGQFSNIIMWMCTLHAYTCRSSHVYVIKHYVRKNTGQ